jgi:diphthamide synthase (EF-2-diphthine--ammonia ligase)
MKPRALLSWSTGKDSAHTLDVVRRAGELDVVGLITTVTSAYGRVSMHGVRESLLDAQADAVGLPCHKVPIPAPCPNEIYEREFGRVLTAARSSGVTHVIFGDLFLADLRAYREARLAELGLEPVFPLWLRPTRALAADMLASGLRATVTCVDPKRLDPAFAGRAWDPAALPPDVDPCGENGEFHTFTTHSPAFSRPIAVTAGEVVHRDGFVFADLWG